METWLSGPEHFFEKARRVGILPWEDDDDRPKFDPSNSHIQQIPAGHLFERSPHDALPKDWQVNPLRCGVSINVGAATLSVGKILLHCKD